MMTRYEPYSQLLAIRWSDLDPNGHVRHSAYYDYGAQVRFGYLEKEGCSIDWMVANGIGPVLFREEARFYRELRAGDELDIDVRLAGLSGDHRKWRLRHRIMRGDDLCATIDLDGAWLDQRTRKIAAPPDKLRRVFEKLERTDDYAEIAKGQAQ